MDHSTAGDALRRVARINHAAWLISHGIKPLERRLDGAGRFVTWTFPETAEVERLLDLLLQRDAGVSLMVTFAEAYNSEMQAIARLRGQHRRGDPR
jgi:hypothetical protein